MVQDTKNQGIASRRKYIQLVSGSAIISGFAGCSGTDNNEEEGERSDGENAIDNDGDSTTEESSDSNQDQPKLDVPFVIAQDSILAEEAQFNIYNPRNYHGDAHDILAEQLLSYNRKDGEFTPVFIEDWSFEGEALLLNMPTEYTWQNGDAITADDLITKFTFEMEVGQLEKFVTGISKQDDHTVELALKNNGNVNESALLYLLTQLQMNTPQTRFGDLAADIREASEQDAVDAAIEELTDLQITEPLASSAFKFVNKGTQDVQLELRSDHPQSDQFNFTTVIIRSMDTNQVWPALLDHRADFIPEGSRSDLPDWVLTPPQAIGSGMLLIFNQGNEWLADTQVRKALANVLNRTDATLNAEQTYIPAQYNAMMSTEITDNWLGDTSNFDTYAYESAHLDKAASLLEEAGFTQNDGDWQTPDGDPFELTFAAPTWPSWLSSAQAQSSKLADFGIEMSFQSADPGTLYGTTLPQGDYDLGIGFWGGGFHPAPNFNYFMGQMYQDADTGAPEEFEVPMPVGEPDGSTETINIEDQLEQLATTSGEEAKEIVRTLGWTFNQSVPALQIFEKSGDSAYDTTEWNFPDIDSSEIRPPNPHVYLFDSGQLTAKDVDTHTS